MMQEIGIACKLRNSPLHQWSTIKDILVWLLKQLKYSHKAFNECPIEFVIKQNKKVLLELWSIIHPVHHIQIVAQRT